MHSPIASSPRVFMPPRPFQGRRWRRAVVVTAAGALMLLGVACGGADAASTPTEEGVPETSVAALAGAEPGSLPAPVIASAIFEAPSVPAAPVLPEWVVARLNADPPQLALNYPAEGSVFTDSYVVFSGKAEPGSIVAAGPFEAKANASGDWSLGLVLGAGQNVATFHTTSEEGVETKESVTVHFKPKDGYVKDGEHDKDKHQNKDHDANDGFQAWQKYGSCGDAVPYDVYKGKAVPGTTVTVTSPYGSGSAVAGDDGYWKVKVTFEAAPVGEAFTVTVSDGTEVKTFTFTRKK